MPEQPKQHQTGTQGRPEFPTASMADVLRLLTVAVKVWVEALTRWGTWPKEPKPLLALPPLTVQAATPPEGGWD